jgi:uncharacterized protein YwqG
MGYVMWISQAFGLKCEKRVEEMLFVVRYFEKFGCQKEQKEEVMPQELK